MARLESKVIMGYLPIEERHHQAIFSLITPATPDHKLLDPMAGAGEFLHVASKAWNVTPYANELDQSRAETCINLFGPQHAVRGDVERLSASLEAFGLLWVNPPYDHDAQATDNKRVEFRYLRHCWKWAQMGGVIMWVIYQHHLTQPAAEFLAKNSASVDVWALPGKHLNTYDQIVVVAVKGKHDDPEQLYQTILHGKSDPNPLIVQSEPVYKLPQPRQIQRFTFAPDNITAEAGLRLIETQGAWQTHGFQALFHVPAPPQMIRPIVPPRPGHTALVLAAGIADGAGIETAEYGTVALRGKTSPVCEVARIEVENDPQNPDHQIKKTTHKLKPTTTLNLLAQDGTRVEMAGDNELLKFITQNKTALAEYLNNKFSASYDFDMNSMGGWLSSLRLKGKYELYTAQKHVISAVAQGFETRKGILLIGAMGVGKTALGSSVALGVACGVAHKLHQQMRPDQVTLIVAPPHLIDKWKREILSLNRHAYVEQLNRHEDVKAFMQKAETLGAKTPKIGLIKRDLTKLGAGFEPAIVWREHPVALWSRHQDTPMGCTPDERVTKQRIPTCPRCGETVTQEKDGARIPVSDNWLKSGKRTCDICHSPLWQVVRDTGSRPKTGEKYPPKNPRYRLDEYLKRIYPDRVFLLIWDEAHEAQHGDTGNGQSFGRMAGIARKVLAMTGTPFNGRSSSLFNLEYHLNPRIPQQFNWGGSARIARKERGSRVYSKIITSNSNQRGRAEAAWVDQMGVREQVTEERPTYDSVTGAYTGTTTYERPYQEAPGISPLLVAEVLDHSVFFSLGDLGKALPDYHEIAQPVEMDADTYDQYDRTRAMLKDYLIQMRWNGDATFRGAYLQWSMGWPNRPHVPEKVIHNRRNGFTGERQPHVVTTIPSFGEDRIYAKEQALINLVRAELEADRPCVVYVRQTVTHDIQPRLEQLLRQHVPQAQPFILRNTVSAERREKVIDAERANGMNVLICNPELVKTGLGAPRSAYL